MNMLYQKTPLSMEETQIVRLNTLLPCTFGAKKDFICTLWLSFSDVDYFDQ